MYITFSLKYLFLFRHSLSYPSNAVLRHRKLNSLNNSDNNDDNFNKNLRLYQLSNSKLSLPDRIRLWMVNEGLTWIFISVWVLLGTLVFTLGFIHYDLNDDYDNGLVYTLSLFGSALLTLLYCLLFSKIFIR